MTARTRQHTMSNSSPTPSRSSNSTSKCTAAYIATLANFACFMYRPQKGIQYIGPALQEGYLLGVGSDENNKYTLYMNINQNEGRGD